MIDFLRDPAWQGIAGIITAISLILFISTERSKLSLNFSPRKTNLIQIVLLVVMVVGMAILTFGSYATINALVKGAPSPWGLLIAGSILGGALAGFFAIEHYFVLQKYIQDFNNYVLRLIVIIISMGIIAGISVTPIQGIEVIVNALFYWTAGVFMTGNAFTALILWDHIEDKENTGVKPGKQNEKNTKPKPGKQK